MVMFKVMHMVVMPREIHASVRIRLVQLRKRRWGKRSCIVAPLTPMSQVSGILKINKRTHEVPRLKKELPVNAP